MNISVAMCTYNGSRFLGEQLKSLGAQTKQPFELVICDDGSTDATPELVREFATAVGFPVRFISNQTTLGSTKNFDQAINLCRGEVIALCDQDDLWAPAKLERLAEAFDREPGAGGVFSDASLINDQSVPLLQSLWQRRNYTPRRQEEFRRNSAAQLLQYNPATGATFAFRSSFLPLVTPIPEQWVHDAWIALLIATQAPLSVLPEKLISYRLHSSQQVGIKRMRPSHSALVSKWSQLEERLAILPVNSDIRRTVQRKLRFFRQRQALQQLGLMPRAWAAASHLPDYFRFARGLFSYMLDVAGVRS